MAEFMSQENTEPNPNMGIGFSLYMKAGLLNLDCKPDFKNAKSDYTKEFLPESLANQTLQNFGSQGIQKMRVIK